MMGHVVVDRCRRCDRPRDVSDLQADVSGHCCTACVSRPSQPPPAQVTLTVDTLAAVLRRVQLVNLCMPVLLSVIRGDPQADPTDEDQGQGPFVTDMRLHMKVTRWVSERDTGAVVKVQSIHTLPWSRGTTLAPAAVYAWVYGYALRDMLLHELAEAFRVDGERIYDPHRVDP